MSTSGSRVPAIAFPMLVSHLNGSPALGLVWSCRNGYVGRSCSGRGQAAHRLVPRSAIVRGAAGVDREP
jgi:hypothetical protein